MKLTRQEVYALIDGERTYQDERWPHDSPEKGSHNVGTYILFIRGYTNKAIEDATFSSRHEECLPNFRKIAALAVRCMEGHGIPPRMAPMPWWKFKRPVIVRRWDRAGVYEAIDSERDYQDNLRGQRTAGKAHRVGDYLLMLNEYVARAQTAWVDVAGDRAALDVVRKIAGICVRCMENHGCSPRKQRTGL